MKFSSVRLIVALTCAVILAACGGSSGTLVLGGTITGLTKSGLVLTNNNSATLSVAAGATTFAFADLIPSNEGFNVTVKTQPTGAVCTPSANSGSANSYNSAYVVITCVTDQYKLGGTIEGLADTDTGLVLVNGSDTPFSPAAGATTFVMPDTVGDGDAYGITVLTSPAGKNCVVNNGTGYMPSSNLNTVQVVCSASPT
jgi:hypothetical protein